MIDVLRIPLAPLSTYDLARFDSLALVDSQPRGGNVDLPRDKLPTLVFDPSAGDGLAWFMSRCAGGRTTTTTSTST
jgi:hypothetical protein